MYKHPRIPPSVPKQDEGSCELQFWSYFESHCYLPVSENANYKNWEDAQDHCKKLNKNANLVTIKSEDEQNFLLQLINAFGEPKRAWIGMKAVLEWYDSSNPEYTNWASGEPDGQATNPCVWMYGEDKPQGVWHADKCDLASEIGLICKMPSSS